MLEEQHAKTLELYSHVDRLLRAADELTQKNREQEAQLNEHEAKLNELTGELFVHQTWIEALQQLTAPKQVN